MKTQTPFDDDDPKPLRERLKELDDLPLDEKIRIIFGEADLGKFDERKNHDRTNK